MPSQTGQKPLVATPSSASTWEAVQIIERNLPSGAAVGAFSAAAGYALSALNEGGNLLAKGAQIPRTYLSNLSVTKVTNRLLYSPTAQVQAGQFADRVYIRTGGVTYLIALASKLGMMAFFNSMGFYDKPQQAKEAEKLTYVVGTTIDISIWYRFGTGTLDHWMIKGGKTFSRINALGFYFFALQIGYEVLKLDPMALDQVKKAITPESLRQAGHQAKAYLKNIFENEELLSSIQRPDGTLDWSRLQDSKPAQDPTLRGFQEASLTLVHLAKALPEEFGWAKEVFEPAYVPSREEARRIAYKLDDGKSPEEVMESINPSAFVARLRHGSTENLLRHLKLYDPQGEHWPAGPRVIRSLDQQRDLEEKDRLHYAEFCGHQAKLGGGICQAPPMAPSLEELLNTPSKETKPKESLFSQAFIAFFTQAGPSQSEV